MENLNITLNGKSKKIFEKNPEKFEENLQKIQKIFEENQGFFFEICQEEWLEKLRKILWEKSAKGNVKKTINNIKESSSEKSF